MEEVEILEMEEMEPHQEYQEELSSFLKETTKENSFVYEFKFDEKYCYCKVVKYELDGSHQELDNKKFSDTTAVIKEILEPFLKNFAIQNEIIINTISPSQEDKSNLKVISENNDMINIFELEDEQVTKFSEIVDQEKKNKQGLHPQQQMDEKGVGNIFAFIISLLVIGVILFGMLLPSFAR